MSRRNKLEKFAELLTFPNVYQNYRYSNPILHYLNGDVVSRKGEWVASHFGNNHPLALELACGWGEYAIGLAISDPQRNFMGIDIKGNRIWKGAKQALEMGLKNVAFLRTRIELLDSFFLPGEISEIWITFPDPFLRESKQNRRLTSPFFLQKYHKLLPDKGQIHLKTDSPDLYEFTLESFNDLEGFILKCHSENIYNGLLPHPALSIRTKYENQHLAAGKSIKYIQLEVVKV